VSAIATSLPLSGPIALTEVNRAGAAALRQNARLAGLMKFHSNLPRAREIVRRPLSKLT
jgi:hypothetical protein